jgi:hypothetical protein
MQPGSACNPVAAKGKRDAAGEGNSKGGAMGRRSESEREIGKAVREG